MTHNDLIVSSYPFLVHFIIIKQYHLINSSINQFLFNYFLINLEIKFRISKLFAFHLFQNQSFIIILIDYLYIFNKIQIQLIINNHVIFILNLFKVIFIKKSFELILFLSLQYKSINY